MHEAKQCMIWFSDSNPNSKPQIILVLGVPWKICQGLVKYAAKIRVIYKTYWAPKMDLET